MQWLDRVAGEIAENEFVCNRYRLTHSKQYSTDRFEAVDDSYIEEHLRYNIAPTQQALIIRKEHGGKGVWKCLC